jgi:aminoglycoside 3'-phosphotransferase-1
MCYDAGRPDGPPIGRHLTSFDPLSVLPPEWRADIAGSKLVPITSGMSGAHVYRVRDRHAGDQYLKIAVGAEADHLRREVERTKWLASMGIRVPDVVRQFDSRDSFAMTMTTLGGRSAEHARAHDKTGVVRAIGLAFAALHILPTSACPFDETLTVRLARAHDHVRHGAIDATQFDARNAGITPEALYRRLAASAPAQEDCVVAHGDATLSNLIVGNDGEIGFIDCGNCGKADRYVDLVPLVGELADRFGSHAPDIFLHAYGGFPWDERKAEFYRDLYELF